MGADEALLDASARLPKHVVYRTFVKETVILNLQTAKYHGLNPTGGRMLEILEQSDTLRDAAATLADEYEQPLDEMESDLVAFCNDLLERGLIEMGSGSQQ